MRLARWVACVLVLCVGCSRPKAPVPPPATPAAEAPEPDAGPLAPAPEPKKEAPPAPARPAPTHPWWSGAGPEVRLNLTPEEQRQAVFLPSLLAERRRQAEAKLTTVRVTLRLAADRTAVEEAFVVVYPPDRQRALSDAERMRAMMAGNAGVPPIYLTSTKPAPLNALGHFAIDGFVTPPRDGRRSSDGWELVAAPHRLTGTLIGKGVSGTLALNADGPARPTAITWQGGYLDSPDAEVAKAVESLREHFTDPQRRGVDPETLKVRDLARKGSVSEDMARDMLAPGGTVERVDQDPGFQSGSMGAVRERHLYHLAHVRRSAADFARRSKDLQPLADALTDLSVTAAGDVVTAAQLDDWVRRANSLPFSKIDATPARGLALVVRVAEYARHGKSEPRAVVALVRRFRPDLDDAAAKAVADRVLAAEAKEVERLKGLRRDTRVRRAVTLTDGTVLSDVVAEVTPKVVRDPGLGGFRAELIALRATAVLTELAALYPLSPEETALFAAACLDRGNLRHPAAAHRTTVDLAPALRRLGKEGAVVADRLEPPAGMKANDDKDARKRLPAVGTFGADERELGLYRRLIRTE